MSKFKFALALVLTTALTPLASIAHAGFFEDVGDVFEGAGDIVKEVVIDPIDKHIVKPIDKKIIEPTLEAGGDLIEGVVDLGEDMVKLVTAVTGAKLVEDMLIEGKSLEQSLDEVLEDAKTGLQSIAAAPMLMNHISNLTTELTGNVLGDEAAKAMALLKLPQSIANALPSALMETLIATTEKAENGEQVVGIPLNAALKQAHQYYEGKANPLPPRIAKMLELGGVDPALIANAKYAVDDDTGSVPALINYVVKNLGENSPDNHAVAVGNIIVFANPPGDTIGDLYFWAHEIHHTAQYADKGFDGFAAEYTTHSSDIEQQANDAALAVFTKVKDFLVTMAA